MLMSLSTNLLESYQQQINNNYDEVVDDQGNVKPHWQQLFNALEKLGIDELTARSNDIIGKLRENGVTYNIYESTTDGHNRPWKLDPIPFLLHEKEWELISKGLIQRAKLMDAIYQDIYGSQLLIKDGILPSHVVYGNYGFSRACYDVKLPSKNQLIIYATDIARGPDQRMWVLDSRTQSPSGSGYALENRSVISKFLPELTEGMTLNRLAPFFNTLQESIFNLSKTSKGQPNIVYLTPGPDTETYFEHTYLASYLGYTLVQGDDLMVRDNKVWLKSITGLEQVDVIIRRVDDEYSDPLELREDSRLGVPGLLQAIRMGNVVVLNPPGSSVLENNALLPFMNRACEYFFGEKLLMPNIATWWCGQAKELAYVMDNLATLIIKKANRNERYRSIFARTLSPEKLEELRKEILAKPQDYVAQQESQLSTTPSFVDGKIEPRFAAIRAFLVSDGEEYHVLKGGLTRSSAASDRFVISNQLGGISKDTWIVGDKDTQPKEKQIVVSTDSFKHQTSLPSRSAENLFWAGRYCERSMTTTKWIKIIINTLHDNVTLGGSPKSEHIPILLQALTHLTLTYPGFLEENVCKEPYQEILDLTSKTSKSGSLVSALQSFLRGVISVNDKWNHDTRRNINLIEESFSELKHLTMVNPNTIQRGLERLQTRLFAFYGVVAESLPRDNAFYLFESGKLIERILAKISVLRTGLSTKHDFPVEKEVMEAILINHHLLVYYRQLYKSHISLETVLDMVIMDDKLPYSLCYLVSQLYDYVKQLPNSKDPDRLSIAAKSVLAASTKIKLAQLDELTIYDEDDYRLHLDKLLSELYDLISSVTTNLTNQYFTHTTMQHSLMKNPENTDNNEI
ncbi:MAG: circularly permuted type 2 ATP-grasp protein [Spirosomataceae bacterium]